jgi:trimethylamine--corrinoid protein Co-methyltransferase
MKPSIISVITEGECASLTGAAFQIIEEFGVLVTHAEAVELLLGAGARRAGDGRIRVEEGLVRELVARAPSRFSLHDRSGGSIEIGSGRCWTICGGTVSRVLQWPELSVRPATRSDVARFARLCDRLPLVHCVVPLVEAQDVERSRAEVVTFMETLAHTTKFVLVCPVEHASARAFVEMARIATRQQDLSMEPKVGLLATLLPDLRLDDHCASTLILAAREGVPLIAMGGSLTGCSCPNTVAASAVSKAASELFLVALAELARPGTPVLVDLGAFTLDMNEADLGEAGPEYPLSVAALAQVARSLGLPTYSCALHCEAKTGDFQAGLEKMAGMLTCLLARVDLTCNLGMLSRCSMASYEQLVLDHELCAFVDRFGRGVRVDEDTLAMDVVREVGLGGDYLAHEHTVRHCRSGEIWYPRLLDRTSVGAPARELYERAHAEAERILRTHDPAVEPHVRDELASFADRWAQ